MFLELFEAEIVFYALRALMSKENGLQSNCESHLKLLIILKTMFVNFTSKQN